MRNHYVPQTYLRKFGFLKDERWLIHRIFKKDPFGDVGEALHIKEICVKPGLYSLKGMDGVENEEVLERLYTKTFDDHYQTIYDGISKSELIPLTISDRLSLIAWVVSMELRNARLRDFIVDRFKENFEEKYIAAVSSGEKTFRHQEREIKTDEETIVKEREAFNRTDRPYVNAATIPKIIGTAKARLGTDLVSLVTLQTGAEFITSDKPVITEFLRDEKGQVMKGHILTLPIDSKRLLKIAPNITGVNPSFLQALSVAPENEARYALERNEMQLLQCSRMVLGSKSALEAFQKTKRERMTI